MKNLQKNILFILLVSIIAFGCNEEEFLDEAPITELSTKSFFESSNQFEQAVNSAYSNLRGLAGSGGSGYSSLL
ncbi:MAG: hypothetical protein KGY69_15195, partial [Bacteroidales bacterium]|nr:hypothetical protein [Bacteroidales bacterium]